MSNSKLVPANDHVLAIDTKRETVLDGITMPDNLKQQEMVFGLVIEVGPACTHWTRVQDKICYGPYAGKNIVLDGVEFRLLREGQIEAYVRDKDYVEPLPF